MMADGLSKLVSASWRNRYDEIGDGYSRHRRQDPHLMALIESALGRSDSVVNVGAGTGSYETSKRTTLAVEPSWVMIAQRSAASAPVVCASAGWLPLRRNAVGSALAVLSIHHWDDQLEVGIHEMRRVARGPVVIVTFDPLVSSQMWLMRDYMPEAGELDRATFPSLQELAELLGGAEVSSVMNRRDTPDWTLGSFWAHPERVLDPLARAGTSGFSRMPGAVVNRVVRAVEADLESGLWDSRNGHLRHLSEFDVGMRLVVGRGSL